MSRASCVLWTVCCIAASCVAWADNIDPTTVEQLTPEEAKQVVRTMKSFVLHLPRLSSLSPEVAAALRSEDNLPQTEIKTATYTVMVSKEVSPGVRKCVPEQRERTISMTRFGTDLLLDGITDLSDSVAKELASHNGLISLNGLQRVSPAALRSLATHNGGLSLNGLKELDPKMADILAEHRHSLTLDGVKELSNESAAALEKHQGRLSLNGLKSVTPQQAKNLCGNKSDLSLDGIQVLPDEVAEALAQHHGRLSLNGVTKASARAVKALVNSNTTLPPEIVAEGMKEAK